MDPIATRKSTDAFKGNFIDRFVHLIGESMISDFSTFGALVSVFEYTTTYLVSSVSYCNDAS